MPYILNEDRKQFDDVTEQLPIIHNKGELEYIIFSIMKIYMSNKDYRYSDLHATVYAVQHCADEFRRRFLDKREDEAIKNNGDIL